MPASLGRNYNRLWSASAFSNLADGMFQVALPLLAVRLTKSPAAVAGVSLAGRLPWLLFALQAGALADRLDRRRTMVNVDLARVVLLGGLAAIVAAGQEHLAVLYVVAFLLGIGETLFDTSAQSIMPAVVDRSELSRANGRLYAVELTMNQFVGPPAGGVLAALAMALAFAGSAACYLVAALALMTMTGAYRPERTGPRVRLRTDIAEGIRYLWNQRLLRTLAMMVGTMNLAFTAAFAVFPLFAVAPGPMGLSEVMFGVLLTTSALGSLAGSFLAPRAEKALGRGGALRIAVLGSGAPLAVPAITDNPIAVGASFVATGLTVVVWNVITVTLRQRIVPDRLLGRVNAGYRLLAWGTMPVGAAIGGLLAELFGIRTVFVAGAVGTTALLALRLPYSEAAIEAAEAEGEADAARVAASAADATPAEGESDEAPRDAAADEAPAG